jgi:hypothetical protein
MSLNFPCFLSSALASKLCLQPAELNLPRLTTVYAGFSCVTAVAAFHTVLIQTPCSKSPWEISLPFGVPHGWLDCVPLHFFFFKHCNNYPFILTLVPWGDFLNILIIRLADAVCIHAIC